MASNTALIRAGGSGSVDIVAGKRYFFVGSVLLLAAGIAELIAGAVVIADSSGYYIGGVYVGIVAIITATRGLALYNRSHLIAFTALLVCSIIVSIVGTAIQASNYNFVSQLEACSSYSSTQSTSCSIFPAYYTCTGNSDYYTEAEACALTYFADYGATDNQCSCVQSGDSGTCYSYTNIKDCHKLVSVLAGALQTSYAFDLICLFLAVFLLIFAIISFSKPSCLQNAAEKEAAENYQSNNAVVTPSVVIGSAASPIVVQGTAVAQAHTPNKGANYV